MFHHCMYNTVILSGEHEPQLDKKDQQGGAEQSKGTCNNLLLVYNFKFYNTLAYFSVNGKPHNLYLVQLYQNTGDFPIDNIAAVTVSLHQPVYAKVY